MTPDYFLPYVYKEGSFVAFRDATVNFANYSLQYGLSVFGGIRAIPNPKDGNEVLVFRLGEHAQRLAQSSRYLNQEFSAEKIEQAIIEFIRKNEVSEPVYIRPFIYINQNGIAPKLHGLTADLGIYGLPLGDYLDPNGITCSFSSWKKTSDNSIPSRGKINGGYINSALAKSEAHQRGFDEALLLDQDDYVVEASAMNIFMVRNGQVITPSTNQDILEGIVRKSVIELAKHLDIKVIERPITKSELIIADEVFLTGTAARVTPVTQIEQYHLSEDKPVTSLIRQHMETINRGEEHEFSGWVTKVII
jgi:branched-chain amino acid aminotransferase